MLDAISAPRRRRILRLVWTKELSAGEIAAKFDVSWAAISQHLAVLKEAGLLTERRESTRRLYRTDVAALGSLRGVLEEMWRSDLAQMKKIVDRR
ncbi:MAG: metalloregulator ArsR/SmtB family transcription factor [Candidatus Limnocylindria bacterium]